MTDNATAPIRQTTHAGQRVRTRDGLLRGIVLYHPDAEAYRKGLGWANAGHVAFVTADGVIVDLPADGLEMDEQP